MTMELSRTTKVDLSSVSKATPTRRNLHLRQLYTGNALRERHISVRAKWHIRLDHHHVKTAILLEARGQPPQKRVRKVTKQRQDRLCCCCMPFSTIIVVNPGYPGLESSVLVSSWRVCPIRFQGSKWWGERCSWTGEEHPTDPFHSLDNLKSQSASVSFYRSSKAYSGRSGAVTEWPVVVSSDIFPRHW